MDGITKYVFRQVGTVMFFITLCLTLAIWLTQSLRFVDLIVNRGLPVVEFLYLSMLLLPRFLVVVLPVALFASVLFTYNSDPSNQCPGAPSCPCNFNNDAALNSQDFFDFLGCFFNPPPGC